MDNQLVWYKFANFIIVIQQQKLANMYFIDIFYIKMLKFIQISSFIN
jgi:hypothetical protein